MYDLICFLGVVGVFVGAGVVDQDVDVAGALIDGAGELLDLGGVGNVELGVGDCG